MSLLNEASFLVTPNGYKASTLYAAIPTNGNGDMTFTRATTATRVDENDLVSSVDEDIPRIDYTGGGCPSILLEPLRTNLLLNSATVVTQTITTTAVANTLSFYGTGTITLSGTFAGTLVGTGASNRVSLTFTPTAGSLVLTVSGSCTNGQLEAGAYPTSCIPTTTASVTRNADAISKTGISDLIGQTEGVLFVESAALFNDLTTRAISISNGTADNRIGVFYNSISNTIIIFGSYNTVSFAVTPYYIISDETQFAKIAIRYKVNDISLWVNGVKRGTDSTSQLIPLNLSRFGFDSGAGASPFYAKTKQLQLYKTYLTDAEMAALTTL